MVNIHLMEIEKNQTVEDSMQKYIFLFVAAYMMPLYIFPDENDEYLMLLNESMTKNGYVNFDINQRPGISVAIDNYLMKNPLESLKEITPLIMGENPVYWLIYINRNENKDIANFACIVYITYNNIQYAYYKINEKMIFNEERIFEINGNEETFKIFY
ncbi:MAG: hypothetical protein LBG80_08925 [Bacteroidales bacterium]|nr:hypothetical protein [Bacteroidales bacterium]